MKPLSFVGLILAVLGNHAAAAPLVLQPGSLLEELRTGVLTIHDDKLSTALGQETNLRLIKRIKGEYGTQYYFEIVNGDKVHFCEDGTDADYLGLTDGGSSSVLQAYQKRVNANSRREYVRECADYFYLPQ